jgi:hypothetical protein
MEDRGLIFIPDISGFTRLVNETEVQHSRLIIQELLEIIIAANKMDLEVSEIEGDAILFYKFGPPPTLNELYAQIKEMFCSFHRSINSYAHRRYCQCRACSAAIDLTLKVITHYGEFTGYTVKNFHKLIGKDIIVAHQLLKNNIEQHEYWLVTKNLLKSETIGPLVKWMNWNTSAKETELGEVPFHYTYLKDLRKEIPEDPMPDPALSRKRKVMTVSAEYDCHIITLFHATGDFKYRSQWQQGVKSTEEMHFLPRIGMRCRCIFENGQSIIFACSYSYSDERIEFCELQEGTGNAIYYTLEKLDLKKTKLTIDYYIEKNPFKELAFHLARRKKLTASYHASLSNLHEVVKRIKLPDVP